MFPATGVMHDDDAIRIVIVMVVLAPADQASASDCDDQQATGDESIHGSPLLSA
jgi:hypothetical protein